MTATRLQELELYRLLAPTVDRLGLELVAVELATDHGRRVLRVSVDKPGGVGVDDCARASHAISPVLDVDDPIEGAYSLELSSPGIDRPLMVLTDFVRFAGYEARIRLEPGEARRRYRGTLLGAEDEQVLVEVDGTTHRIRWDAIERASLVLDLDTYRQLAEAPPPRVAAKEPTP